MKEFVCRNGLRITFTDKTVKIYHGEQADKLSHALWYERITQVLLPADGGNRIKLIFRTQSGKIGEDTVELDTYSQVRAVFCAFELCMQPYSFKKTRRHASRREIWKRPAELLAFLMLLEILIYGMYFTVERLYGEVSAGGVPVFFKLPCRIIEALHIWTPLLLGLILAVVCLCWGCIRSQRMSCEMDILERANRAVNSE